MGVVVRLVQPAEKCIATAVGDFAQGWARSAVAFTFSVAAAGDEGASRMKMYCSENIELRDLLLARALIDDKIARIVAEPENPPEPDAA